MSEKGGNWLLFGVLGWLAFGLFGFFNKLSTFADPFAVNVVICIATLLGAVVIWLFAGRPKLRMSWDAFTAGACGSIGTIVMLYALEANLLILVYPFATFAGVVFFGIFVAVKRPHFKLSQGLAIGIGLLIVVSGIFLANAGAVGGMKVVAETVMVNKRFLGLGLGIAVLWGLLSWFWFRARLVREFDVYSCLLCTMFGLAGVAIVAALVVRPSGLATLPFAPKLIWPVLAGLSTSAGATLVLTAYGLTAPHSKVHSLIISVLTNGEAIPAGLLALIFLGESMPEGLLAILATVVGITLLNYAENF